MEIISGREREGEGEGWGGEIRGCAREEGASFKRGTEGETLVWCGVVRER